MKSARPSRSEDCLKANQGLFYLLRKAFGLIDESAPSKYNFTEVKTMKKIIFTLLFLAVSTQLALACPLHDGADKGKSAGSSSGQAAE